MSPVEITYFSDVLCVWADASQARIDAVKETFSDAVRIEHRFCSIFGDTASKITSLKSRTGLSRPRLVGRASGRARQAAHRALANLRGATSDRARGARLARTLAVGQRSRRDGCDFRHRRPRCRPEPRRGKVADAACAEECRAARNGRSGHWRWRPPHLLQASRIRGKKPNRPFPRARSSKRWRYDHRAALHPSSGKPYRWQQGRAPDEIALAPLPDWLLAPRFGGSSQGRPLPYWRNLVHEGVSEGRRNWTIASFTGHLLWHGVDPDVTMELMLAWNRVRCRPPLEDEEVYPHRALDRADADKGKRWVPSRPLNRACE